ncbi:hypothetical protein AB0K60_05300 [Thermopolyspora sp. NPDC052614]
MKGTPNAQAATKGAINAVIYSPAHTLMDRRVRGNAVAPTPVGTQPISAT